MRTISVALFCIILSIIGCKRKGDIKAFDETSEWKIESYIVRTSDLSTGDVKEEVKTNYEFFRVKDASSMNVRFAYNVSFKYSGKYFEIESFVDSTLKSKSKTLKTTIWSGNVNEIKGGTEYTSSSSTDESGVTNFNAFIMNYSTNDDIWTLHPATSYNVSIRKKGSNRLKVIITTLGGQSGNLFLGNSESVLELIK